MMTLDNGATDGESDSHTVILRGVERLEESVRSLRIEPHSRILYRQTHTIAFVSVGSDEQVPRTIVDGAHRVGCIPDEIQDDLLQLDAIAGDKKLVVGKFPLDDYAVSLKFPHRQSKHLSYSLVQVHRFGRWILLAIERAQSSNHLRRAVAIANRASRSFASAIHVG